MLNTHCLFLDDIFCKSCRNDESIRYDHQSGDVVCTSCGFISVSRFIDLKPEYNLFADGAEGINPVRVGGAYNENLPDGGLGTYFDVPGQKRGSTINPNQRYFDGIRKLRSWGDFLGIETKVIRLAVENFEGLFKDSSIRQSDEVIAAILLMTARMEKRFMNLSDLENISGKSKRLINRSYWLLKRKLLKSRNKGENSNNPSFFAKMFADKLNLPIGLQEKIKKIGEKFENVGILEGKNPKNIASVIIYNESGKSFKEIAEISEISDVTIKKTYEHLRKKLGDLDIQIGEKESFEKVLADLDKLEL